MKGNFLIPLILALIFGFIIGYMLKGSNLSLQQIIPWSCSYAGKTYRSGESFKASDGCNSCSCNNGQVLCTLIACNK